MKGILGLKELGDINGLRLRFGDSWDLATLQADLWRVLSALQHQVPDAMESDRREDRGFPHLLGARGWVEAAGYTAIRQKGFELTPCPVLTPSQKHLLIVSDSTLGTSKSLMIRRGLSEFFSRAYLSVQVKVLVGPPLLASLQK